MSIIQTKKTCKVCGQVKALRAFNPTPRGDSHFDTCRACVERRKREHRDTSPENDAFYRLRRAMVEYIHLTMHMVGPVQEHEPHTVKLIRRLETEINTELDRHDI